jgi:hypothetical protein
MIGFLKRYLRRGVYAPPDLLRTLQRDAATCVDAIRQEEILARPTALTALVDHLRHLHILQRVLLQQTHRPVPVGQSSNTGAPAAPTMYIASTLFLRDCFDFLVQGEPEWLHAVSGTRFGDVLTLERMVHLRPADQSKGGVLAEPMSVFDSLANLSAYGHTLHGVFHSHRCKGVPRPSDVDTALQHRLDAGGFMAIQAIFTEDGHIRFFGGVGPFEIIIYGTRIEKIHERVFKLHLDPPAR